MGYPDIDYINEMKYYVSEISYHLKNRKYLNEDIAQDLLTLAIDLMEMIELYINDKCDY